MRLFFFYPQATNAGETHCLFPATVQSAAEALSMPARQDCSQSKIIAFAIENNTLENATNWGCHSL
jgi:hypothetical protein